VSQSYSAFCAGLRTKAKAEAERFLAASGFSPNRGGVWAGRVSGPDVQTASLVVTLPPDFPDRLPLVRVLADGATAARAHIDPEGNLCLGPRDGLLLDTSDAARIMRDVLARAAAVLFAAAEADRHDAEREFNAYWRGPLDGTLLSIVRPGDHCGEVWVATITHDSYSQVVAESREQLKRWTGVMGVPVIRVRPGYHVGLHGLPVLPAPGQDVTLANLLELISAGNGLEAQRAFQHWLARQRPPVTVMFSGAMSSTQDEAVFAAVIPPLAGEALLRAQRGFRPGRYPGWRLLAAARREPVRRPEIQRADPQFVLPRGGAVAALASKKVVVFGCGAVGSHLASLLASSGVGNLLLVDKESLTAENLYRHLLGAESLGREKAVALRDHLHRRFPDLAVAALAKAVEEALEVNLDDIKDADLIVLALGDETLERRLDQYFGSRVARVHVWLEPLGIGGHVLACGSPGSRGCLHCLYKKDDRFGLVNMAALAAPGQTFRRAMGGCAGTFTPFGAADAVRAAVEGTREVVRLLTGAGTPRLTTWVGDRAAFETAGFGVSARCRMIGAGVTHIEEGFAQPHCGSCGSAAA
jgi:hypothetical protein